MSVTTMSTLAAVLFSSCVALGTVAPALAAEKARASRTSSSMTTRRTVESAGVDAKLCARLASVKLASWILVPPSSA
jgi:hypothetical protein